MPLCQFIFDSLSNINSRQLTDKLLENIWKVNKFTLNLSPGRREAYYLHSLTEKEIMGNGLHIITILLKHPLRYKLISLVFR